jgi:ubiquinone/menaquinone biosynthesis C-methylase UbiE
MFEHKIERSSSSHAILEQESRKRKAKKIVAVLNEYTLIKDSKILDIGTGSGDIPAELSLVSTEVYSIDIVDERKIKKGYTFIKTKDESLPYADNSFDVVITNHVIEHTPNQDKHTKEVMRVLKTGGHVYIATPNKWWLTDPHYKIPFISWLPRGLSSKYLKVIQKKEWDIYPLSSRQLKKKFRKLGGKTHNALVDLMKGESSKSLDMWGGILKVTKYVPKFLLNISQYFSPTLIFVIRKIK